MKARYKANTVTALKWEKNIGYGERVIMYEIADLEADKSFSVTEDQFNKMFEVIEINTQMKSPFFETGE